MEKKPPPTAPKARLPDPPLLCAERCTSVAELKDAMMLKDEELEKLEAETRDQSKSADWRDQRVGRLTSSMFYPVYTKTNTLDVEPHTDSYKDVLCW